MHTDDKNKKRVVRPFPRHALKEASVIAFAIQEQNAGKPMKRLLVANAIGRKPTSPEYRDLLSSSYKYGLTEGTEKAEYIKLTELGQQFTKPSSPEMEIKAKQRVASHPELFHRIYTHFKDSKLPKGTFFENMLETEFKVPREYVKEVAALLENNGNYAGIIRSISGSPHIMFDNLSPIIQPSAKSEVSEKSDEQELSEQQDTMNEQVEVQQPAIKVTKKIFISHGKNKKVLDQIKTTLEFGGYEPIIATMQEATAIPVPEKIMNAMHECEAGIINISADESYQDKNGEMQFKINENVLIEIGAAFVLYKKRVILVVDKRITLPSNLQGLYVCYYEGDTLDWESGLKLQKALTEFSK